MARLFHCFNFRILLSYIMAYSYHNGLLGHLQRMGTNLMGQWQLCFLNSDNWLIYSTYILVIHCFSCICFFVFLTIGGQKGRKTNCKKLDRPAVILIYEVCAALALCIKHCWYLRHTKEGKTMVRNDSVCLKKQTEISAAMKAKGVTGINQTLSDGLFQWFCAETVNISDRAQLPSPAYKVICVYTCGFCL